MTNADIIFSERMNLMKEGKIKSTGRKLIVEINGEKQEIEEPEQIHTYQIWKELGYQVQKGQQAVAKVLIWKFKPAKDQEGQMLEEEGKMFMKMASFFSASQVEKIGA